jgi:hypothetical protein
MIMETVYSETEYTFAILFGFVWHLSVFFKSKGFWSQIEEFEDTVYMIQLSDYIYSAWKQQTFLLLFVGKMDLPNHCVTYIFSKNKLPKKFLQAQISQWRK